MKTKLFTLLSALGFAASSHAAIVLESAWFLNEGTGSTTDQATLGSGQTWNQVTNPNEALPGTTSEDWSGVGTWGASSGASGSTASYTFDGNSGDNTPTTNVDGTGMADNASQSTYVAWINPTAANGSIISYSPSNGNVNGGDLRFLIDPNGNLRAEVSGGFFIYDTVDFVNDGWNMVAAVFDGNTGTSSFYIGGTGMVTPTSFDSNGTNGRAISTGTTLDGDPNATLDFVIGTDQAERAFVGGIDMVAAYNGAATEAELDDIYANGIAIPEPGTLVLVGVALGALMVFRRRSS